MKVLKIFAIIIIVLIVLLAVAGFAATQFISKSLVENQLSEATGRQIKINGDLKPVFSLTPAIKAESVSFANASWGSRPELAKIGKFEIQLQLLPLLSKKIVVDKFDIDGADILLEQKNGQWNFDLSQATAKAENEKDKPVAAKKPLSLDISALSITNSKLVINQGGAPTNVVVKSLKLAAKDNKMNLDFDGDVNNKPLKVSATLPPLADLMDGGTKKVETVLNVESDGMKLKLAGSFDAASKKAEFTSLSVQKDDMSVSAKGWADVNAKKIDLADVVLSKGALKLTGNMAIDASGKKPYVKGSFNSGAIDASTLKTASAGGDKGAAATPTTASTKAEGKMVSEAPLPLDGLDAVNADLNMNIASIKSGNIVLDKISAAIKLNNGVLTISPLNASFAGGQITSSIAVSKGGTRINIKASNLLMEKILAETVNNNDFKNGVTNADISLAGSGNSVAAIMASLSGASKVTLGSGSYSGEILKGHAAQFANLLYGDSGSHTLVINCAVTDINWASGTGSLSSMGVDTKYANVSGTGTIRPVDQMQNLVLTPTSKLASLNSLAVPVGVKGTFDDPQVSPLTGKIIQNIKGNILQGLQSSGKFNLKKALGVQKGAAITSPCGAAPAAAPAAADANNVPVDSNGKMVAPVNNTAEPENVTQQKADKLSKKLQKWGF